MALKRYVCARHPNLSLGAIAKFHNGLYETDVVFIQKLIERNDLWGSGIIEVPQVEDIDPVAPFIPEMNAAVDAIMAAPDDGLDVDSVPEPTQNSLDVQETLSKSIGDLKASDINRMNKPDLIALAEEVEAKVPDYMKVNFPNLKRAVKVKLELGA